jgi:hypothetical protein
MPPKGLAISELLLLFVAISPAGWKKVHAADRLGHLFYEIQVFLTFIQLHSKDFASDKISYR